MIRKYHNHKLQTNPWHREEEPQNQTFMKQINYINVSSLVLPCSEGVSLSEIIFFVFFLENVSFSLDTPVGLRKALMVFGTYPKYSDAFDSVATNGPLILRSRVIERWQQNKCNTDLEHITALIEP